MKKFRKIIPEVIAIVARQEKRKESDLNYKTAIIPERREAVACELEDFYRVRILDPSVLLTVFDFAAAVSKGRRIGYVTIEIAEFAKKIYNLHLKSDEVIESKHQKDFRRVADCYIMKMKIPRKNKLLREKIKNSLTIEDMAEHLVWGV